MMIRMMRKLLPLLLLAACTRTEAQTPPALQHYEIRADRLPAPYATASAGNPPQVVEQPAGAHR